MSDSKFEDKSNAWLNIEANLLNILNKIGQAYIKENPHQTSSMLSEFLKFIKNQRVERIETIAERVGVDEDEL